MMWNKRFGAMDYPDPANPENLGKFSVLPPGAVDDKHWSGHQVVSTLLPPINLTMKNKRDIKVDIKEGILKEGQLDKDIFSKASKGIVHVTYNDYGPEPTVNMLDAFQNTIEQFLIYDGFSVGISDLVADESTRVEMNKVIQKHKKTIEELLLQVHLDLFDNNTGKSNQDEFEGKVFIEFSEGETLSRTEVKKMKAIITTPVDKYRPDAWRSCRRRVNRGRRTNGGPAAACAADITAIDELACWAVAAAVCKQAQRQGQITLKGQG
jgi:hypothetical protein